jgi:hypothetical protein
MGKQQPPMLTWWQTVQQSLNWPEWMTHTVLYVLFISMSAIPFMLASTLSAAASQEKVSENMAHYGMAFIPLALAGHLSHVAHEFLGEGIYNLFQYFFKLYDSVVSGIPIGSREVIVSHFINGSVVTFIKFMMISGGMLGSLVALVMIARRFSERNVSGRILPHMMLLIFFWVAYLFIFLGSTETPPAEVPVPPAATSQSLAPVPLSGSPGIVPQGQPGSTTPIPTVKFWLTLPDIKSTAAARLSDPAVSQWLQSAQAISGTGQYRLALSGLVLGGQRGAQVQVSLDTGILYFQPLSALDAQGYFKGNIYVNSIGGKIPLVFQLVDIYQNTVLATH